MTDDLKLSPQHGVNPSMELCFWCGQSKGIVLSGLLPDDQEAPREVILGYEPCEKCAADFEKGIHIVEVSPEGAENQPPIQEADGIKQYPTGRSIVVDRNSEFIIANNITGPVILVDTDVMNMITE